MENEYFQTIENLINDGQTYDKIDELMDRLNDFVDKLKD